jgi:hypothetical protein
MFFTAAMIRHATCDALSQDQRNICVTQVLTDRMAWP